MIEINFIYLPQEKPQKIYEDKNGRIIRSNQKDPTKINVALGYFANKNPKGLDSLLALEPMCVSPYDYEAKKIRNYYKIFSWCEPGMHEALDESTRDKLVTINHPFWEEPSKALHRPLWHKRNGIVIVSNNKEAYHDSHIYHLRLMLADYLYEKGYNISWYGQTPLDKPYYKGLILDKLEVIRQAKFCICPENCYDEKYSWGYFSEKMPDAWFGGAVPLYMGCYNIDNLNIPHDSYIDLRKYVKKNGSNLDIDFNAIENTLNHYSKGRHINMLKATRKNIESNNGLFYEMSIQRAYSKIIETFKEVI